MLRSAFSLAVNLGEVEKNPFTRFQKTAILKKMPIAYDPSKYRVICNKTKEMFGKDFSKILDIYLFTGLREAEGPALRWDNIDFKSKMLTVPAAETKKKTERRVPLADRIINILLEFKNNGYEKPIPWQSSSISHNFIHARDGWKYKGTNHTGTEIPGTFHSIRKTTVTYLKKIGLNSDFIDVMIGHDPDGVSARHYTDYELALNDTVRVCIERMVQIFYPSQVMPVLRLVSVL